MTFEGRLSKVSGELNMFSRKQELSGPKESLIPQTLKGSPYIWNELKLD